MQEGEGKFDVEVVNDALEIEEEVQGIKIEVKGFTDKGSGLTKYTVYLLRAQDKDGHVQVYRRFSQFFALRQVMLQRWPGCFIPAVPDKKVIGKNDDMIKKNRQRFLDSFVKKIAHLPHLYLSQQFQVLLRSKQSNVTQTFEKYQKPSYDDIISRYQSNFSQLAGKQINNQTHVKISSFYSFLQSSQLVLSGYKDIAKRLAIERSNLDTRLASVFTRMIPDYEKTCLTQYVGYDDEKTVFINPRNNQLQDNSQKITSLCSKNPYWLIYDLIKYQDRDGEAFLAAIQSRNKLENKKIDTQNKIRDNKRQIEQISMGNTTVKSFFKTGSKEEIKIKLQRQIQELEKNKESLINVIDIISALLAYITIDQYREAKRQYYGKIFKAVSSYEINFIETMYNSWRNCLSETSKLTGDTSLLDNLYPQLSSISTTNVEKQVNNEQEQIENTSHQYEQEYEQKQQQQQDYQQQYRKQQDDYQNQQDENDDS